MSLVARLLNRSGDASGEFMIMQMRRRHLRGITPIEEAVYPRPWTAAVFTSEIDRIRDGDRYYVVAEAGGTLVAYGGLIVTTDEAHVTNIAVDPTHHRCGYGRRLLAHLVRTARARGCGAMTLEVRVSNTAAQSLYRSFGFQPVGVRKKYYENTDDAIVMWLHGIQSPDLSERMAQWEDGR